MLPQPSVAVCLRAAPLALLVGVASACRTPARPVATAKDAAPAAAGELPAEIHRILGANGCIGGGCHVAFDDAGLGDLLTSWGGKTEVTRAWFDGFDFANDDFAPAEQLGKMHGIFRAYPGYFRRFFAEGAGGDVAFAAFARRLPPNPGMHFSGPLNDFEALKAWLVARAAPPAAAGAGSCVASVSAALAKHVFETMPNEGWTSRFAADAGQRSYRCPGPDAFACLRDGPPPSFAPEWIFHDHGLDPSVVDLADLGADVSWWIRSAPLGDYVGYVSGTAAFVYDLPHSVRFRLKGARIDPGFFPDGKGFVFIGPANVIFCDLAILAPPADPRVKEVSVDLDAEIARPGGHCTKDTGLAGGVPQGPHPGPHQTIGSYQSLASPGDVAGSLVVEGAYNEDPGFAAPLDSWTNSYLHIFPLTKQNGRYVRVSDLPETYHFASEGDWSVSPSAHFVASRFAAASDTPQIGYCVRSIDAMRAQGSAYAADNDPSASSLCTPRFGGKPMFSLDERFLAYHQYYGDANNRADLYLLDLAQGGRRYRLTSVPQGYSARYPHFRADGWVYFILEDPNHNTKLYATDAALAVARALPLAALPRPPTQPGFKGCVAASR